MILEACISTKNGLIHAQEFNIPRIELCENLSLDGLTPSLVFQKKANHIFKGEKFIMIRPHANGFNYNKKDVITMTKSIEFAKENGAEGVVFGALKNKTIDFKVNSQLLEKAKNLGLKCTFHKAIDQCEKLTESIIEISEMGFDWVLTSGKEINAEKGLNNLKSIVNIRNRKVKILAGGGVSVVNCLLFLNIGIDGLHFSIDKAGEIENEKFKYILEKLKATHLTK